MWRNSSGTFHPNTAPENMIRGSVEEFLKSTELQSLQELAASRTIISICESDDLQYMIGRFRKDIGKENVGFSNGQWKQLSRKVRRILKQIGVPELIINIIVEKLWPISFEVFKWILCHGDDMGIEHSSVFRWNKYLSIDYEKTAKILVKNEMVEIKNRFKLACFYCLEEEVRLLWDWMNLQEKRHFFHRGDFKKSHLNPIILYWVYYIQELPLEYWGCKTLNYSKLYKYAVENGYLSATKYFLGKLKIQIRNRMISNGFSIYLCNLYKPNGFLKGSHFAIAYYLISELDSHYRGINSFTMINLVSRLFLEWPLQKHFLTFVNRMRCHMRERVYEEILEAIFEKDLGDFKDYDYKKLFMEFWIPSPATFKTYMDRESSAGYKMLFLFTKKHFGFIFDENAFALKARYRNVILHNEEDDDFAKEDVDFFKFLIRERVATKASIDDFTQYRFRHLMLDQFSVTFYNVPLGELMYLMDAILERV